MNAYASMKTRNMQNKANINSGMTEAEKEEAMRQATSYSSADIKPGSMMAKANKVREYNQRNSSKDN